MAATDPILSDPLLSLRRAIAAQALPTLTTSADLSTENATDDLAKATHLYFTHPIPHSIPLNTATRFVSASSDQPVDLRSIFFAWQKKDVAIPEYIASAQELNDALKQKGGEEQEQVQNLVFVERLDLITWLEGASDESEYIKPLEGAAAEAAAAADLGAAVQRAADASAVAAAVVPSGAVPATGAQAVAGAKPVKVIDPRLQEIYNGERKVGDRNSVLRGIKPTVCVPSTSYDIDTAC
jgi:parafibromin